MIETNIFHEWLGFTLSKLKAEIMSELSDKIDEATRSADERFRAITEAIAAIRAEVAEAKARNPTADDLAKLDALDAKIDAFDPTSPVTLPPEP